MNAYIASFMLLLFNAVGLSAPAAAAAEERVASGADSVTNDPAAGDITPLEGEYFDGALKSWHQLVARKSQSSYPAMALQRGLDGLSVVKFRLSVSGGADQCSVMNSSGHDVLDKQACLLVETTVPTPVASDDNGNAKPIWRVLPIRWEVTDKSHVEGTP